MTDTTHYVDNEKFTEAVIAHAAACKKADADGAPRPLVSKYLGQCLWLIAEGVVKHKKFRKRTYREDLVMDAVENCLKALPGFNAEAATRSGKANAFGYYSRICYNAMLRRVIDETDEYNAKLALTYKMSMGVEFSEEDRGAPEVLEYLDQLQSQYFKVGLTAKERKKPQKPKGLEEFL